MSFTERTDFLWLTAICCYIRPTSALTWLPLCIIHLKNSEHSAIELILKRYIPIGYVPLTEQRYLLLIKCINNFTDYSLVVFALGLIATYMDCSPYPRHSFSFITFTKISEVFMVFTNGSALNPCFICYINSPLFLGIGISLSVYQPYWESVLFHFYLPL